MSYIDIFLSTKNAVLKLKNLFWKKSVNEVYNLVKDNIFFTSTLLKNHHVFIKAYENLLTVKILFCFAFLYMTNNLYKSKWLLTVVVYVAHPRTKDFKAL